MALNAKASPQLKALLEQRAETERLIKEAEKAEQAKEAAARKAAQRNPAVYGVLVHDLCERLGVAPEHPHLRRGPNGTEVEVTTSRDERLRAERLITMLDAIIEKSDNDLLEELRIADEVARDQNREERGTGKRADAAAETGGEAYGDETDAETHDLADAADDEQVWDLGAPQGVSATAST